MLPNEPSFSIRKRMSRRGTVPEASRMKTTALWLAVLAAVAGLIGAADLRGIEPLATNFGLGTILHPVHEPDSIPHAKEWARLPCHKDHVYIFAVNGVNPMCLGNFNGLCTYLRNQGFRNTYFGQLYTSNGFATKIRDTRHDDPDARIALIGFSAGANYVKATANSLAKDGVWIDLLVYLVGDTVWNTPASRPENVGRILNIRGKGLIFTGGDILGFNGADIDGARNYRIECRHILAPSRSETLTLLMEELLPLAYRPSAVAVPTSRPSH